MKTVIVVLGFMASSLASGCLGNSQTCVMDRVKYSGTAAGQVIIVTVTYSNSQEVTGQGIHAFPSVQLAMAQASSGLRGGLCLGTSIARHETANATAWIDVGGRFPDSCASGPFDNCSPQLSDPQGHGTFTIRDFEQNYLDITITDP